MSLFYESMIIKALMIAKVDWLQENHGSKVANKVRWLSFHLNNLQFAMRAYNKLQLPTDYAQKILDNQIEFKLSDTPSSEVICNLIQLYSQGVEYYQSIKSYKYLYFKKKMEEIFSCQKKIFTQKNEESEDNQSPIRKKMKSQNQQQKMEALKIKEKQEKLENEVNERIKRDVTKKEAEKIIKSTNEKEKNVENKIKSTLQSQDKLLEQKLMMRKKRSFCKSFSAYGFTQGTQTKESLFTDELLTKPSNDKGVIEPLMVNFQSLIKQDDSDDEKQIILHKKSILTRGKMASMGRLVE